MHVYDKLLTPEEKSRNRNQQKQNRKKKFQNTRKHEDIKPFDRTQSLSLFSSLKFEKSAHLGDVDFGHLARSNSNRSTNIRSGLNPHSILTSLQTTDTKPDDINLGDTAYSYASAKPPLAEDSADSTKLLDVLPGPPRDLKAPVVEARFVVLSWKPPVVNSEDIITYSVYYQQEGSERYIFHPILYYTMPKTCFFYRERVQNTSRARLEDINIGNLQPARVYHFRVVPYNSFGGGTSSEVLTVTTRSEEHVPSAPQKFVAYATSSRSIYVSWKRPEVPNGDIQHYKVYYMEV